MSFRRSGVGFVVLATLVAGCSPTPLPETATPDPANPDLPGATAPYRPVLAGTAAHAPVPLRSWRELNEGVAPHGGRAP